MKVVEPISVGLQNALPGEASNAVASDGFRETEDELLQSSVLCDSHQSYEMLSNFTESSNSPLILILIRSK